MSFFRKKNPPKGRPLRFESLEQRELLSVSPLQHSLSHLMEDATEQYGSEVVLEAIYPAPTDLGGATVKVTDVTSTTMTVSWDASKMMNVRTTDSFTIERLSINSKGEEVWAKVGNSIPYSYTTGLGVYSYELTGLAALTEYTHRVTYGSTTLGTGYTDRVTATTERQEITAEPASSTSITVSWTFAGKKDTKYNIFQSSDGGTTWSTSAVKSVAATGAAKTFTATVDDLDPATEYTFKIEYYDLNSVSQTTQSVTCSTQHSLYIDKTTGSSVELYWSVDIEGTGHQLQICTGSPTTESNWKNATADPVSKQGDDDTFDYVSYKKYLVSGLKDNITYYFRLRYNVSGDDGTEPRYTDPLSFSTPTSFTVDNVTDTTAVLSWTFDTKSGTAYYVQTRTGSDDWANYTGANTTNKTYTLKNLEVGTTYDVRVSYTSPSTGEVSYSAAETITTAVPTTLESVTKDSVTISWDIPNKESGSTVSVQRCDGSLDPEVDSNWKTIKTGVTDNSYTNLYLGSDKQYFFRVAYTDTGGDEQNTLYVSARTSGVIRVSEFSIDSVTLEWDFLTANSNYSILVDMGETAVSWGSVPSSQVTREENSCTITGLTPAQRYHFKIEYTPEDETVKQMSTEVTVDLLSGNIAVTAITDSTVSLHWAPAGFDGGAQSNKNFVIYYLESSDRSGANVWKEYANVDSSRTDYTVKDLIADTAYQFKIAYSGTTAQNAQSGQVPLTCTTEPYDVEITKLMKTEAKLEWDFSTYAHSPVCDDQSGDNAGVFTLQIYKGTNEPPTEAERVSTSTALWEDVGTILNTLADYYYNLDGLSPNTTYYYRVVYQYKTDEPAEGSGTSWNFPQSTGYSKVVEVTTLSNITSSSVYSNSMRIQWDASGTSYTLKRRVAGSNVWNEADKVTVTTNSYYDVSGLTADTEYEFQVEYANGTDSTAILKVSTGKYIPSVISREIDVDSATATVQMKCNDNESDFTLQYRLKTADDSKPWTDSTTVAAGDSGKVSITISTLLPEQEYEFRFVYKANGADVESEICGTTLTEELIPSNVTGSSVKVEWLAASFPDKRSTSGYTVQWREAGATDWKSGTSTTSTTYTVTNLDPNKDYEIRLKYTTVGGDDAYSTLKTITTAQPTATATAPQVGSVKLAWTFTSDADGFRIEYKDENGDWILATTVSSNSAKDVTFTKLLGPNTDIAPETEYTFRIAYKTSQSGSEYVYSEEVEVTTLVGLQLVDNSISTTSVGLKWDYVTDTTYKIFYRITGSGTWDDKITDIDGSLREYTITDLKPGTDYEFQLTYVDNGDKSVELGAKTTVSVPTAPTSISATDITTDGCTLKWSDNTAFEEDYILEVVNSVTGVIFFKGSIGERIGSSTSSADYATHELTGLDTNTKYTVKLYAVNAEGSSSVLTGTFTTSDVTRREKVTSVGATVTPKSVTLSWKVKSVEDVPDPTQSSDFRIEYYYTDENKVSSWLEVSNVAITQNTETEVWYAQIANTIEFGNNQSVEFANKTTYKFRITVLETTVNGVTYGDSAVVEKSAKTADIKVPTVSTSAITLTGATVTVKDSDSTLDKSAKTYKLYYVEGKYTDWTKVPDDAVINSVEVDNDTMKHTFTGLLAGTTYSYVVQWEWAGETISSKAANFTTKALPKSTSIKTGYTLTTAGELASQISWATPKSTSAVPTTGMDISYTIEVSLTGKAGTFTTLLASVVPSTSPKGLNYTSISFSALAAALPTGTDITACKSLSIRIGATFKEGATEVGTSWSSNGKITLPKFA